eukprot:CAMPEP_0172541436 /NCGR_PEP_ID=MMETSP1067-20121228/12249_1 /TAXON_ID=265564 ORGANISM="Thalassiosira punctigera, Strain Tpunct2005C2" /NCGR_SAMPLE_ID=MMETSP1067 /ASSEMBLY_ACC=CAM_ASM_000444 /LENGTH=197 /DNA_ID=CAMNT_0013327477 /DNA_START=80 /DNA_END=674 /DNA_ORIENTATION=+
MKNGQTAGHILLGVFGAKSINDEKRTTRPTHAEGITYLRQQAEKYRQKLNQTKKVQKWKAKAAVREKKIAHFEATWREQEKTGAGTTVPRDEDNLAKETRNAANANTAVRHGLMELDTAVGICSIGGYTHEGWTGCLARPRPDGDGTYADWPRKCDRTSLGRDKGEIWKKVSHLSGCAWEMKITGDDTISCMRAVRS